ncbi:hypothetical protein GCM10009815_39840 [Nocardioides marmoribigeumensis]
MDGAHRLVQRQPGLAGEHERADHDGVDRERGAHHGRNKGDPRRGDESSVHETLLDIETRQVRIENQ